MILSRIQPRSIIMLRALYLSGADEQRPRDAVVVAVGRTKILWRYRAISPTVAGCRLRERRCADPARFPVIGQLRARGRIAGAISEQRLAVGGGYTRASARRPGGRTGLERRLDGVGR